MGFGPLFAEQDLTPLGVGVGKPEARNSKSSIHTMVNNGMVNLWLVYG
jgi:hypothetical protein